MDKNKLTLRRLRKTKPSRHLQKQQLFDLEKRISVHVGSFLVLIEEGTPTQITEAKQRATNERVKFGPDMEKLAQEMGGKYPVFVHDFLDSVDNVLYSANGFVDEAKVVRCFNSTQRLEKAVGE